MQIRVLFQSRYDWFKFDFVKCPYFFLPAASFLLLQPLHLRQFLIPKLFKHTLLSFQTGQFLLFHHFCQRLLYYLSYQDLQQGLHLPVKVKQLQKKEKKNTARGRITARFETSDSMLAISVEFFSIIMKNSSTSPRVGDETVRSNKWVNSQKGRHKNELQTIRLSRVVWYKNMVFVFTLHENN